MNTEHVFVLDGVEVDTPPRYPAPWVVVSTTVAYEPLDHGLIFTHIVRNMES